MSVTVVKDKGATVITVSSDRKSMLPPLCQILRALCYSPKCCSVNEGLTQSRTISVLGTIQIMVGLFNIGLGPGRISHHPEDFAHLGAAYWLGGVFFAAGLISIVADRFPSRCLVGFAVLMNVFGSVFSVIGVVMYAIDMADVSNARFCDSWGAGSFNNNCIYVQYYFQRLVTAMDITMIVMAVLQLCVCISVTVLGIRALANLRKNEGGSGEDDTQTVLKEVLMNSPGA